MTIFTGTENVDTANASSGLVSGFTGGTGAELQDNQDDTFFCLGGHDIVVAGGSNDILAGGAGNDQLNGGGGKDTMAQAGGKDPEKLPAALEAARAAIESALSG